LTARSVLRILASAVNDTWAVVKDDVRTDLPFVHRVECSELPERTVVAIQKLFNE